MVLYVYVMSSMKYGGFDRQRQLRDNAISPSKELQNEVNEVNEKLECRVWYGERM